MLKLKKIQKVYFSKNIHLNGSNNVTNFQGSTLNHSQDTWGKHNFSVIFWSYACYFLLISPIALNLRKIQKICLGKNVYLYGFDDVTNFQGSMLNRSQDTRGGAQCAAPGS